MTRHEEQLLREHFGDGEKYEEAARRLRSGEPLAYILGEWYFWRYSFKVTPDVLVPQPDTEILVERAIKLLPHGERMHRMLGACRPYRRKRRRGRYLTACRRNCTHKRRRARA